MSTRKVILDLAPLNAIDLVYLLPEGTVEAVFDGDIQLERSGYAVDEIDRRIKLKRRPFGEPRALAAQ